MALETAPVLSVSARFTVSTVFAWSPSDQASIVTAPPTRPDAVKRPLPSMVPNVGVSTVQVAGTATVDPLRYA